MDPLEAIRMVTLNTAEYFGLRDVGAVAPGYRADLLILSSLAPVRVRSVIKDGTEWSSTRASSPAGRRRRPEHGALGAMNVRPFGREAFRVPCGGERIRVIGLVPGPDPDARSSSSSRPSGTARSSPIPAGTS